MVVRYGKSTRSVRKILGSVYNELTKARRSPYLAGITDWKNTRTIVKRLVSSDDQMGISLEIGPEELPTEVVSVSEETTLDSGAPAPTEALLATGWI